MHSWLRILVVIVLCLSPLAGHTQAQAQANNPVPPSETAYPYLIGVGVIAGVVATQAILFGAAGFPFVAGAVPAGASIAPEVSVGISRMYAVTSAVVGGWIGNWLYDH